MFVRTRSQDRARLVVTSDEASQFDEDWTVWNDLGWWLKNNEEVRNTYADFMPPLPDEVWTISNGDGEGYGNWQAAFWARKRAAELIGMVRGSERQLIPNPDPRWAISDTLRENIKEVIAGALDGGLYPIDHKRAEDMKWGLTENDIADHIQVFFDREYGVSTERTRVIKARVIARTEIMRAQVGSNLNEWRQGGIVKRARWLGSADGSCAACSVNNGIEVDLGSPFPSGARSPLDTHPLCRCKLTAVL